MKKFIAVCMAGLMLAGMLYIEYLLQQRFG